MTPDTTFLGQVKDLLRGLNRGVTSDLVGTPVDVINMALQAVDATRVLPQRLSTSKPVMGSDWIQDKLQSYGLAYKPTHTPTEGMGRVLGGLLGPQALVRAAMRAAPVVEREAAELGRVAGQMGDDYVHQIGGRPDIIVGEKAARRLGGKTLMRFEAGKTELAKNTPSQEVWRKHGIELNAEGKPVFELPLVQTEQELLDQIRRIYPGEVIKSVRLAAGGRAGSFNPRTGEIYARGSLEGSGPDSRRSVLEHEVQHGVDKAEGFSSGSNLDDPNYWNTVGEVRARNAEYRLENPEMRKFAPEMTEEFGREKQIIKQDPAAMAQAVKEPGGMWHPRAVERLAGPLYDRLAPGELAQFGREELRMGEGSQHPEYKAAQAAAAWSDKAIRNYLNKYAGTSRDPLKDIEIPFGEGTKRWEDLWDNTVVSAQARAMQGRSRDTADIWSGFEGVEKARPEEPVWNFGDFGGQQATPKFKSYLSHVGDYLRQNVPPEKLGQYDLVRAVRETAANDARVAKQMEKAAAASMKDMPVYKDYSTQNPGSLEGMKWVELKKPEKLTAEQMKGVRLLDEEWLRKTDSETYNEAVESLQAELGRKPTLEELHDWYAESYEYGAKPTIYQATDASGQPIKNNYTGEMAGGSTPEDAWLAGRLAEEGNQMGHCVGGYCENVAAGASKIYSLRDAKGKSHVTVEVQPSYYGATAELPRGEFTPEQYAAARAKAAANNPANIFQIKGKGNKAPVSEYLPYVQDFVKSGKWGEVGDLGNTGMVRGEQGEILDTKEGLQLLRKRALERQIRPQDYQSILDQIEVAPRRLQDWLQNFGVNQDIRGVQ